ncbi:MAG: hypothetical protein J0L99_06065 [Chitinophagales bacterium]|nr:hypothetical protein [Chitinophagales bacterium]
MKHIFLPLLMMLFASHAFAQVPQTVNFQAVARNSLGDAILNQPVQVRLTIRENTPTGNSIYCATHNTTTNAFGAFTFQMNRGDFSQCANSPDFESINWTNGSKWMQVEFRTDLGAFNDLGAFEISSSFYALAAREAQRVSFINPDNAQDGNVLRYDASSGLWKPASIPNSGPTNIVAGAGINVSLNGNTVTISNAGDSDNSSTNELQTLQLNGAQLSITNGNSVTLPLGSDAQTLQLNGSQLSITNGNSITLPLGSDTQTLQLNGSQLSITNGNSVNLPSAPQSINDLNDVNTTANLSVGKVLKWDGANWTPQNDNTSSGSGGSLNIQNPLLGDGTPNDPLRIGQNNAVPGQALVWDGSAWVPGTVQGGSGGSYTAGPGITIANNVISAVDNSPSNEIQTLSLAGNQLTLSNGGGSVALPTTGGSNVTLQQGTGIGISGSNNNFTITNTGDTNPSDDVTTSTQAGGDVSGTFSNLQINPGVVGNLEIANGSINGDKIANGTITPNKLSFSVGGSQWQNNGQKIYYNSGFVGIGLDNPQAPLNVIAEQAPTGQNTISVLGFANAPISTTTSNIGLLGSYNTAAYGTGVAGYGFNFEPVPAALDFGVYGSAATGVLGSGKAVDFSSGTDIPGVGVMGIGKSTANVPGIGINGIASGTGSLAGYFLGNVRTDGRMTVNNSTNGAEMATMGVGNAGHGFFNAYGPNGNLNLVIGSLSGSPNSGTVGVFGPNQQSTPSVLVFAESDGDGQIEVNTGTGNNLITITKSTGNSGIIEGKNSNSIVTSRLTTTTGNAGSLSIYGPNTQTSPSVQVYSETDGDGAIAINAGNGNDLLVMGKSTGNSGVVETYGSGGNVTTRLTTTSTSNGTRGTISVHDENGNSRGYIRANSTTQSELFVNTITGVSKSFRMVHPQDPTKEIWYACIEGPEAAAYERGTAQLVNGVAAVQFSDHFQLVANREGMTVMLTPLSGKSNGLAVVEKTERGFKVQELMEGTGNYQFDWEVKCVRKGLENFQIIRDRDYGLSDLPSIESMRRENTAPASAPARIETDVPTSGRNIPAAELTPQKGNKTKKQD